MYHTHEKNPVVTCILVLHKSLKTRAINPASGVYEAASVHLVWDRCRAATVSPLRPHAR